MAGRAPPRPDQLRVAMSVDRSRLGRGTGRKGRAEGRGRRARRGGWKRRGGPRCPLPTAQRRGSVSPRGAEGGKLGREVSGGKEAARPDSQQAGSGPTGWGRRGAEGVGWWRGAGGRREERRGEALPLQQKEAGRAGSPGGQRGGDARGSGRPAGGSGSRLPTGPSAPCDAGFGFALFLFVRCEGKWSARKEASRAGGGSSSPGGGWPGWVLRRQSRTSCCWRESGPLAGRKVGRAAPCGTAAGPGPASQPAEVGCKNRAWAFQLLEALPGGPSCPRAVWRDLCSFSLACGVGALTRECYLWGHLRQLVQRRKNDSWFRECPR